MTTPEPPLPHVHVPAPAQARRFGWPVWAWGLWDWGSAAFNAVITTFVFTVYLTDGENEDGTPFFGDSVDTQLGLALAAAGLLVAALAPVTGQRADRAGRRGFWLAVNTLLVVACSAGMFFVKPEESYLWLGLLLLAAGNIFFQLAEVNYNAMLNEVSSPATVGRVSGLGWGLGYIGGIVLLLFVYFGLISPDKGLFGVSNDGATDVRVTMLICAVWTLVFSLPVILTVRDTATSREKAPRASWSQGYRDLFASIKDLWHNDRNMVKFLLASAIFRDGLAGVFTFGAVLAAGTFGFSAEGVIIFGVVANIVAGIATVAFGTLDDRIGAKRVIVIALSGILIAGVAVFVLHDGGRAVFWTFGLALCVFVGPAQSASRTFLARIIPPGREGQIFGLYATTGRAVSFLAPALWSGSIALGAVILGGSHKEAQYFGIIGIVLVVATGLALLLQVKAPHTTATGAPSD